VLKEFVQKKHYNFIDRVDSWQESIRMGCKPLEADGSVDESYADQIIECVEKYGPYIVIMPGVAMPHSQENAVGVTKTTISFMKIDEPVCFDKDDPEKYATLFFTVASCNHQEHLENIQRLSMMLMNEELVAELMEVTDSEGMLALQAKYLD